MTSLWKHLVLAQLDCNRLFNSSYLYRKVKWFSLWREASWLLQWSEAIGACLLSLVLMLAPFVSTSLIGVLLVAVIGYWIIVTVSENPTTFGITPIHIAVLIYWLIATIATALSPVKTEAVSGWIKLTLYLGLFALGSRILRSPRLCNWVITSFLLIALIVSSYGVRQQYLGVEQLATWNDPNSVLANDTRVYSYLGNPNLLGGYLLPAIALSLVAIFIWRSWIQKFLAVTMLGINLACLFFTDSRGAWLATLALIFVMFILLYLWWREYLPRFWQIWLLPLVFCCLGGMCLVAILGVESIRLRFLSIFAGREDSSNNFRINVWEAVFKIIADYPITGIGPGNEAFNAVYPRYMDPLYPALSAYSIFLEHIVEFGYIGFSCFLWLIVVTINHGIAQVNRLRASRGSQGLWVIGAIAAVAGLMAHGMVDTVWYRPPINTLWWFMLAIIASQFNKDFSVNGKHPVANTNCL
ncbi:MAG: IctB family putative bicarbonate transporter [Xenococcaceae cyanobacterium MO_167.B27]|nr:IctB family putative bicarbonate transporter [Xenococcaceae cyanobacterium MO_167.B27]